jgi:hypothetical protein
MTETIAEMARREADEAERETDEPGEPGETDEPGEATAPDEPDAPAVPPNLPPGPPSEAAIDRAVKELDKASDAYVRKVTTIQARTPLGLIECPLCPVPGFVPDTPIGDVPPEQRLAVMSVLGEGLPVEQRQSEHLRTCDTCDGLGMLATGSRRPGFAETMCEACQGNGFIDSRHERAALDVAPPPQVMAPPSGYPLPAPVLASPTPGQVTQGGYSFSPTPGGSADPYGRMPGHPLWGQPIDAGGI